MLDEDSQSLWQRLGSGQPCVIVGFKNYCHYKCLVTMGGTGDPVPLFLCVSLQLVSAKCVYKARGAPSVPSLWLH